MGHPGIRILNAQTPSDDARRLNTAIDEEIKSRNLSPDNAAKARTALRRAAEKPDIRDALLFVYAADAALSWERSTQADLERGLERGYDVHLLGNLAEIRRPNGYDPLAAMAARWQTVYGKPHVNYSGFKTLTAESEASAVAQMTDNPETMQAINSYLMLRGLDAPAQTAFAEAIDHLDVLRDVLSRWGVTLVSDYDSFDAGKDARDYVEAYYQYWHFKKHGSASDYSIFMATDPLRMISRRVVQGIRADRKTMLISIEAIIDEAIKTPTEVDEDVAVNPVVVDNGGTDTGFGSCTASLPRTKAAAAGSIYSITLTASAASVPLGTHVTLVATVSPDTRRLNFTTPVEIWVRDAADPRFIKGWIPYESTFQWEYYYGKPIAVTFCARINSDNGDLANSSDVQVRWRAP